MLVFKPNGEITRWGDLPDIYEGVDHGNGIRIKINLILPDYMVSELIADAEHNVGNKIVFHNP